MYVKEAVGRQRQRVPHAMPANECLGARHTRVLRNQQWTQGPLLYHPYRQPIARPLPGRIGSIPPLDPHWHSTCTLLLQQSQRHNMHHTSSCSRCPAILAASQHPPQFRGRQEGTSAGPGPPWPLTRVSTIYIHAQLPAAIKSCIRLFPGQRMTRVCLSHGAPTRSQKLRWPAWQLPAWVQGCSLSPQEPRVPGVPSVNTHKAS